MSTSEAVPLLEVCVRDPAGEALPADADALQHAITPQLVDHQVVLHQPCEHRVSPGVSQGRNTPAGMGSTRCGGWGV